MCGIVGVASSVSALSPKMLMTMRDTMYHRGPDDAGMWWSSDYRVGLAHRRLAIIDLSSAGHQPMSDDAGTVHIVFNGEIYNFQDLRRELEDCGHVFRSSSDTEVILEAYRAWGMESVKRFNGMFAFAIYDACKQRLFLARDRAGEKPLFYWESQGKLVFASELKALMVDPTFPRVLDFQSLKHYLAYGYVPGTMCILRGVRKLPQGHAMTFELDSGEIKVWPYWKLPAFDSSTVMDQEELLFELEQMLKDSVRRQLVADVPVGILLSGGVDSSLVTAMAAQVSSKPVKTFTISFPGHAGYDEGPYARLVAKHFGTQHMELAANPPDVELLPHLAQQYDEPIADSSIIPTYLVSRLIRQHCTVALGGDGGDELFGGYTHYTRILWLQSHKRWLIGPLRYLCHNASLLLPLGFKGRSLLRQLGTPISNLVSVFQYFEPEMRQRLLSRAPVIETDDSHSPEEYKLSTCPSSYSLLQAATSSDFKTYLVDDILVKVDRDSMLNSLEIRSPWLDYRIVEFAFSRVPDTLKTTEHKRKILPRLLAKKLLPKDFDLERKQGFSIPLNAWFDGPLGSYIEDILMKAEAEIFNRQVIRALLTRQRYGCDTTNHLFSLAVFELWRQAYKISLA